MFQELIASSPSRASRKPLTLVFSAFIHGFFILLLIASSAGPPRNAGQSANAHRSSAALVGTEKGRCQVDLQHWKAATSSSPTEHSIYAGLHSGQN